MKKNILVLCLCLVAYLLVSQILFIPFCGDFFPYLIRPICFAILAYLTYLLIGDKYVRPINKNRIIELIIIIVLIYLIFYYTSGLLFGYTNSTYSLSFSGIIKNIYSTIIVIIIGEYIRFKILTYPSKKSFTLVLLISLIFTLTEISYVKIVTELNSAGVVQFVLSVLIPLICLNFLYSYIVTINSYKGSIIMRGLPALLALLLPIYPTWNWYLLGCLQVTFAVVSYFVIKTYIDKHNEKMIKKEKKSFLKNLIFAIIIVVYVMFVNGAFKFVPIAVMSNSMYPLFQRGDVLIYEKVDINSLKVGDILVFKMDNIVVLHRIKKLSRKNDRIYIITKGDNLNSDDPQITTNDDIIGREIFTIPAVGYPSVILYEMTK